jgi:hypothetical protein
MIINNVISYSIANFGDIPYGKTLYGRLHKANPIKSCTRLEKLEKSES